VKRQTPIMCVIGNPPYSGSSQNMGDWARTLVQPYKDGLNERKINLDDDYIKFIRLAESYVEKSGRGVVGYITNNSYLDGVTLRKMREHLLDTFDSIYILNLFGDIRSAAEGRDENVFDITQGVAIILMVRNGQGSGSLNYAEIKGSRASKNEFLWSSDRTIYEPLLTNDPYYFFYPRNIEQRISGKLKLDYLFLSLSCGIQTKNDSVTIRFNSGDRDRVLSDFKRLQSAELEREYPSKKVWSVGKARADIDSGLYDKISILYRPFDVRHTVLTRKSSGFLGRPRFGAYIPS
jgi:predicted helicase